MHKLRRAVFLDRDGVLNEAEMRDGKPYAPATPQTVRIFPGTVDALKQLQEQNFLLIVVTNQPDVSRGIQERSAVEEIHRRMREELPVDDIFICYHDDADDCDCRKPRPGLVMRAAQHYGIDLARSFLVGDRWRDIDAGSSAGCRTIWLDRGYDERAPSSAPDLRVTSLPDAVAWILKNAAEGL
jgi:D-glycero-D-manno-heptose 1,7-bisphosphate phosphatase